MNFKKILFVLGLLLAIVGGAATFYIYKMETKPVTIYRINPALDYAITPGTMITSNIVQSYEILGKDKPPDSFVYNGMDQVFATKYIYPGDILVVSKLTDIPPSTLGDDERIISIKPADPGLLGMLQPGDFVSVVVADESIPQCRVIAVVDSNGMIMRILPNFAMQQSVNSSILDVGSNANQSNKGPDRVIILTSNDKADFIAKNQAQQIGVIFEGRDSLKTSASDLINIPVVTEPVMPNEAEIKSEVDGGN
ncbi:MAG: hypothetical protein AB7G87_01280 [Clostridia bacterium]